MIILLFKAVTFAGLGCALFNEGLEKITLSREFKNKKVERFIATFPMTEGPAAQIELFLTRDEMDLWHEGVGEEVQEELLRRSTQRKQHRRSVC